MPVFRTTDIEVSDIDTFTQSLTSITDPSSQYSTIESKKYTMPSDIDQKHMYRMVKCEIIQSQIHRCLIKNFCLFTLQQQRGDDGGFRKLQETGREKRQYTRVDMAALEQGRVT